MTFVIPSGSEESAFCSRVANALKADPSTSLGMTAWGICHKGAYLLRNELPRNYTGDPSDKPMTFVIPSGSEEFAFCSRVAKALKAGPSTSLGMTASSWTEGCQTAMLRADSYS